MGRILNELKSEVTIEINRLFESDTTKSNLDGSDIDLTLWAPAVVYYTTGEIVDDHNIGIFLSRASIFIVQEPWG